MIARRLNQRGDTIVEVLLALLVLGAVLAGAYVSSSSSLRGTRMAQERGEALKLIEGQLERIKSNPSAFISQPGYFCVDLASGLAVSGFSPNPPADASADPLSGYPSSCRQGNIPYYVSIIRDGANGTYAARARWVRIGGGSNQEVKISYRVY